MSDTPDHSIPEFATAMRGYDRFQVDEYIEALMTWLDDMTERAQLAEGSSGRLSGDCEELRAQVERMQAELASGPPRTMDQVSERISSILSEAARTAEALRDAARTDADGLLQEAAARRDEAEVALAQAEQERKEAARAAAEARHMAELEAGEKAALLIDEATKHAARLVADATEETAAMRAAAVADVEQLRAARNVVARDLARLRAGIDDTLRPDHEAQGDGSGADVVDIRERSEVASAHS